MYNFIQQLFTLFTCTKTIKIEFWARKKGNSPLSTDHYTRCGELTFWVTPSLEKKIQDTRLYNRGREKLLEDNSKMIAAIEKEIQRYQTKPLYPPDDYEISWEIIKLV